jgi:hypothetical protein
MRVLQLAGVTHTLVTVKAPNYYVIVKRLDCSRAQANIKMFWTTGHFLKNPPGSYVTFGMVSYFCDYRRARVAASVKREHKVERR